MNLAMKEVEEANKIAIESCHRVLSLLCDQVQSRNLMVETEETVYKFKRVVSLLSTNFGHGKVRKLKKVNSSLPQHVFLDSPHCKTILAPKPLQIVPANFIKTSQPDSKYGQRVSFDQNPVLEMNSTSVRPVQVHQMKPSSQQQFQFLQQQHQLQRMQFQQQQQMKYQADMMYSRSTNSGINLKFDGGGGGSASCTPTMSSTRSFMSSLSMDGTVSNFDGDHSFHLIGMPQSSDQISQQHRRRCSGRAEDGSMKCGSTGKCHCSKRRYKFIFNEAFIILFYFLYIFHLEQVNFLIFVYGLIVIFFVLNFRKLRVKRSIKVPAISNKVADIPPDEYSWRKYGQKPIKGSPHPR